MEHRPPEQRWQANVLREEVEQVRMPVDDPKGIPIVKEVVQSKLNVDNNDDKIFHLTCHVDSSLKAKIEKGEYIDLERLLPKRKNFNQNDNHLEWVSKDGLTFLTPAQDRELKVNNICRWEQAFCVYAAIYSNANPTRSGESWQYVYVINSAAQTYQWDNVYYYDMTFHQLMAEKPHRSWAKVYTQLWQLALRDIIPKGSGYRGGYQNQNAHQVGQNSKQQGKSWRDRCCWHYNRTGSCMKTNCHFDNRCSFCSAWNHGVYICYKKSNTNGGNRKSNSRGEVNNNHSK